MKPGEIMDEPMTSQEEQGALRIWIHNCKLVVEVGTWTGRTAVAITGALPLDGHLYCVDNFCGAVNPNIRKNCFGDFDPERVKSIWYERVNRAGYKDRITLINKPSTEAAKEFELALDLVFIDACHEYPYPLQDIKAWWPLVRPGGILCGHDYHEHWQGVIDSVNEFMKEQNLYPLHLGPGSLWRLEKRI